MNIRHLRWYIGGLLFLSTVINYIDRQTLSVLAPVPEDRVRVDQLRLRPGPHRVPRRLRGGTDDRGARHRPARHAPRPSLSVAWYSWPPSPPRSPRACELHGLPLRARPGRGRQLARRHQGRVGVVPAARERVGGGALRQRLVGRRRRSRPGSSCRSTPVRQLAPGVHPHRRARVRLAARLPRVYRRPEEHP